MPIFAVFPFSVGSTFGAGVDVPFTKTAFASSYRANLRHSVRQDRKSYLRRADSRFFLKSHFCFFVVKSPLRSLAILFGFLFLSSHCRL